MESTNNNNNWSEGEHVDAFDQVKRWCNAQIIKTDQQKKQVRIAYSGFNSSYNETLPFESPRLQKQWKQGMPLKLNNRLDIYDTKDKVWREATIVDIKAPASIKIRYRGYNQNYDEWLDTMKESARIKEVGSYSLAEGHAKHSLRMQQELKEKEEEVKQSLSKFKPSKIIDSVGWGVKFEPKQEFDYQTIDWQKEERRFAKELSEKSLRIIEMGRDGNCLFRSIAHQAYGDEDLHKVIRTKCMDYILSEKEYYKDFIIGGSEQSVEAYVSKKRQNAVWGDDLEIQALSEIYNRPIEIYAYSNVPMRTFHEQVSSEEPFRLSYHGASHYNSIVHTSWNYDKVFIKTPAGIVEDQAIKASKCRIEESQSASTQDQMENMMTKDQPKDVQNFRLMAQMIQRSREDFQIQCQKDMEEALKSSMTETYSRPTGSTALYRQLENENVQRAINESQQCLTEDDMIKQALAESMKETTQKLSGINIDEALMQTIMALSNNEQIDKSQMSPAITFALENGFSLEQAIEAQSVVGDDADMILSYLFDKVSMS